MLRPFRGFHAPVAGVLVLALAACASPTHVGPGSGMSYPAAAPRAIFVSRGETAYDIARRYNVPLRDLLEVNGLRPPYTLRPGQRLVLPVPREYKVQAGDTIYGLSRRFELDMNELVRLNGISSPYMIRVGQVLRLPGSRGEEGRTQVAEAPPPQAAPRPSVQAAPAPASPVQTAPTRNTGSSSRRVEAMELPPLSGTDVPVPAAPPAPIRPEPVQQAPSSRASQETAALPSPPPVRVERPATVTPPAPAPRQGKRFLWPVQGAILSDFGPKPGGLYNDGINIGAAQGSAVQVAENGVVVYAGNELKGYGNLILVRHADGWLTAYAHLDRMEVDRGQEVRRGQRIGTVGRTGNVSSPQLHFGIRRNEKAMDPKDHLEPASS